MDASDSLDPARASRTPLARLATCETLVIGLGRIEAAIERHFPENLFADLDRVAVVLDALRTREGDAAALARADRIAEVHAVFGQETPLRFRYAHDFLYGFDWARRVARDPSTRSAVGPYDEAFLAYSMDRAAELCALVARNDRKYGPLERGAHRNPFPFRRDLEAERTLHRALAADGAIPVRAWDPGGQPVWDRPFTALREAKAHALGLAIDAARRD
jgi:hypothetical protein